MTIDQNTPTGHERLDANGLDAARDAFEAVAGAVTSELALRRAIVAYRVAATPTAAQADGLEVVAWQWNAPLGGGVVHDETAAQVFSINAGGLAVEPLVRQSEAAALISSLRAENERLLALTDRLRLEAQIHSGEARGANSTVYEIYQVLSGGKGEPGNWHGAEPARRYVEAAEARATTLQARLDAALEVLGLTLTHLNDVQDEGPIGEGWQSDELNGVIAAARQIIEQEAGK